MGEECNTVVTAGQGFRVRFVGETEHLFLKDKVKRGLSLSDL